MIADAPWDPNQYLTFAGPRLRPALDLIARIPIEAPETIFDLGCGAGNVTQFLNQRWPDAAITGIDMSPEMLARARLEVPSIDFVEADLSTWSPKQPADLVFSNAALQWIPDHKKLLPKIAAYVAPGGVLAVQIPHNDNAPSTIAIKEAAQSGPWRNKLQALERVSPVQDPSVYFKQLAQLGCELDVWETEYHHILEGDDPVLEWGKGTWLRILLDSLDGEQRDQFEDVCRTRLKKAYPPLPDGRTLYPFRRLFFIAQF